MRFYNIVISTPATPGSSSVTNTDIGGDIVIVAGKPAQIYETFSSVLTNGSNDPGALNIEFDLPIAKYSTPMGAAVGYLRIWGPSLKQIGQQSDLQNKFIQISGGMSKGLPLATKQSQQRGLLISGYIYQAFANWVGVDMTLDITLQPSPAGVQPTNLQIVWPANVPLSQAIQSMLQRAFPTYKPVVTVSNRLTFSADQVGTYTNLSQLAQWIKQRTEAIVGDPNYRGVDFFIHDNTIYVTDATTSSTPRQLDYADLIGQPTWIPGDQPNILQLQITTVLRGDLGVNDYVALPPGTITNSIGATQLVGASNYINFQGSFQIAQIRHVGNFRQPDAESWVTVLNCYTGQPYTGG